MISDDPRDEAALSHLRELIRIPTVSPFGAGEPPTAADTTPAEWGPFDDFAAALERLYPQVHRVLDRDIVAGHSLLFRWAGLKPGPASVLLAHYDVVPATAEGWAHPPFAAEVTGEGADRVLWGRGTLDNKGSAVTVLEAAEAAAATGFTPQRDVYLFFGHDEETTGTGAEAAVALLRGRGVEIGFVLDEGGAVVEQLFPTVTAPIAVVGVSEKGTTSFSLTVEQQGGHASTPPRLTATARLARAIVRITERPFRARINAVTARMIQTVGAHGRNPLKFVFTHVGLFRPLLVAAFARMGDETAAIVRTTVAVTQLDAGLAANALAERARAVVNVRIAIGSTVDQTRRHLERAIADPLVRVDVLSANDPAPVSLMSGPAWELLSTAITEVYPEAVVTPYVQNGATDSRQFARVSRTVYRFSPFEMSADERGTLHAKNERMHVQTFFTGIRFYDGLLARL